MTKKIFDVAVIGAGLSGLTAAVLLKKAGRSVVVLEADSKAGGRIQPLVDQDGERLGDLGPSWVWPSFQPIAKQWLEFLNVPLFEQYEKGDGILQLDPESAVNKTPIAGQEGIQRMIGGPTSAVEALLKNLDHELVLNAAVSTVREGADGFILGTSNEEFNAKRIICAVPPRIATQNIDWGGLLSEELKSTLDQTPTWMATQAKVLAIYDKPFWRKQGLSGRVASHVGPLVEVHDHCDHKSDVAALFGFVGLNHQQREQYRSLLPGLIIKQLVKCFGEEASGPKGLEIADWALNPNICSELDKSTPPQHPQVMPEVARKPQLGGRLFFGVAETAAQSPGLIEGAFVAGTWAARGVISAITVEGESA